MSEKAEYSSFNGRKVLELRDKVLVLGQRAWEHLKPFGFTNWHETDGWIGCWMERKHGSVIDTFCIQLDREDPIRFRVAVKTAPKSSTEDKSQSSFSRTFASIQSLETDLPEMMKEVLVHVHQ
ncbi:MAG: hypothetical protein JNJ91_01380 [Flavobacteriales bacterium]|nr:hypothetical protein [Flavobacteriales bacterium]